MAAMPQKKIEVRAYELWEAAGKPHGRSEDFWFQATTELAALTKRTGAKATTPETKTVAPKATVAEKPAKPKATKPAVVAEPAPTKTKKKAPAKTAK